MAGNHPVQDDPEQLKNAENLWGVFMQSTKVSIIAVAVVMIILLMAFVPFG